jgi:hypothetical protein
LFNCGGEDFEDFTSCFNHTFLILILFGLVGLFVLRSRIHLHLLGHILSVESFPAWCVIGLSILSRKDLQLVVH